MGMFAMKKHAFLYFVGRGDEEKRRADTRSGIYNGFLRVWLTYSSHAFPRLFLIYQGATDGGHSSSVANSVFTLRSIV
jgi:hypothetical protein